MTMTMAMGDLPLAVSPVYFLSEQSPVHSLVFCQEDAGGSLLCGREDGSASVWDLETLRLGRQPCLPTGSAPCIGLVSSGKCLVTQDKMGVVKCWEKEAEWREVKKIQIDYCGFCRLSINSELNLVACPCKDSHIQVFSGHLDAVSTLKPDESVTYVGYVMACKLIKFMEKFFIMAAYENSDLLLWDLDTQRPVSKISLGKDVPFALDFDENERKGLCGTKSKKVPVFKVDESLSLECVHTLKMKNSGVSSVKINKNGEIVAVGCWDTMIRIFSWKSYKLLTVLSFHTKSIEDLCFSFKKCEVLDCDSMLAATSRDKVVSLWNVSDFPRV